MAEIIYPWNPFQERVTNDIKGEEIRVDAVNARHEFLPRKGPFFARNVRILKAGSNVELKLGVDYAFAHPFSLFTTKYRRNVFGSVVLLKKFDTLLYMDYSTIGAPFVLDETDFVKLTADIMNAPRQADWSDLIEVPVDFPPDPHDHPATQTYDYLEMVEAMKSLIAIMSMDAEYTVKNLLEEHLDKPLIEAHRGDKSDIGLDLTPNMPAATTADLQGNSSSKLLTMAVYKEGLRMLAAGTLNL